MTFRWATMAVITVLGSGKYFVVMCVRRGLCARWAIYRTWKMKFFSERSETWKEAICCFPWLSANVCYVWTRWLGVKHQVTYYVWARWLGEKHQVTYYVIDFKPMSERVGQPFWCPQSLKLTSLEVIKVGGIHELYVHIYMSSATLRTGIDQ